jgi:hypothetical protein
MVAMEMEQQGDETSNVTSALKALSPWLNNPRRTVLQIEVFMAGVAVLLFFQLIFGSVRRRTSNFFIQKGLWLAYTLLPVLISYTLGQMQSSPVKTGLYPVWALSLFLVAGGANSITAYDLDDNKQWKRHLVDLLQYYIYFFIILRLLNPGSLWSYVVGPKFLLQNSFNALMLFLFGIYLCANLSGVFAGWMVNYSGPSKVVADYMKKDQGNSGHFDPVTMKGCTYLVWWPRLRATRRSGSPIYTSELPENGVITVETVWEKCKDEVFTSPPGVGSRIRGACLSYSLSHLLRRRFFGMDCAEARLAETRQFVFQGLLSGKNQDEYTEAFRVIEVELGFLYDLFFTKYASIFETESLFFFVTILKITVTFVLGVLLLYKSPNLQPPNPVIQVSTIEADKVITVLMLGTFLAVEAVQSILYLGSDWAMVSLACNYITGYSPKFIPFSVRKTFGFLRRRPLFNYWQNKIGQYSVIEGSKFLLSRKDSTSQPVRAPVFLSSELYDYIKRSFGDICTSEGLHFVKLTDMLKLEIVSSLKSIGDGHLSNGESSLQRNGVFGRFSWALLNEAQTEKMLIWHIATEYCKIQMSDEAEAFAVSANDEENQLSSYHYRDVAIKLSRYCAYLMSNVPELLPGNPAGTSFIFDHVLYETREDLGTKKRNKDLLKEAISRSRHESTILAKGLKLGTEIESIEDSFLRWKVMAEFWAETILYIAPSDNAKAHMEHLAQGGEFLTHIWALLTHAGILCRPEEPTALGTLHNASA